MITFSEKQMVNKCVKAFHCHKYCARQNTTCEPIGFYFLKKNYFCIYSLIHEFEIKLIVDRYAEASSTTCISNNGHQIWNLHRVT